MYIFFDAGVYVEILNLNQYFIHTHYFFFCHIYVSLSLLSVDPESKTLSGNYRISTQRLLRKTLLPIPSVVFCSTFFGV